MNTNRGYSNSTRRGRGRGNRGRFNRKNNGRNNEGRLYQTLNNVKGPNNLKNNYPFPQSKVYKLTMVETFVLQQTGVSYCFNGYVINDIQLPSVREESQVTGLQSMKNIYQVCHVQKVSVKFSCSSNDSFPMTFGIIFRDRGFTSEETTRQNIISSTELGFTSGPKFVGQNNGNSLFNSPVYNIQLGKVVGNVISYMSDTGYVCDLLQESSLTNPLQKVYMYIVSWTPTDSLKMNNGLIVNMSITFHSRFYGTKVVIFNEVKNNDEQEKRIKELEEKVRKLTILLTELTVSSTEDESLTEEEILKIT